MSKRPKNPKTDEFSFSFGADDELFPLDTSSTGSKRDTKAPKGVRGYLKNVSKSVKNLGIATSKVLLPDAFSLADDIKYSMGDSNVSGKIKGIVGGVKTAGKITKDVAKSIVDDAKTAVKTGYFYKSEEDQYDSLATEFFGDDFGMDDSDMGSGTDGDLSDFGSTMGGISSELDKSVRKSQMSTSKINISLAHKQMGVTAGVAESQIKHQSKLFGQQVEIDQYYHRQKMRAMSNIATNVGKIVTQNNMSIKAQMEYSAKSLAFTQDLHAMMKEIRDAQWAMTKPKDKRGGGMISSTYEKIFGRDGKGFNVGEYMKNLTGGGGQLSMIKDLFSTTGDLGMKPADMVKSMIGSWALESFVGSMQSTETAKMFEGLNERIAGAPGMLNRLAMQFADSGIPKELQEKLKSNKHLGGLAKRFLPMLDNQVKNVAGRATVMHRVGFGKDHGIRDLDTAHPFDNKAHKALTEVIPMYLAKIEAGVNNTEETVFLYDQNKLVNVSSLEKNIKERRLDVTRQSYGYSAANQRFSDTASKYLESGKFKPGEGSIITDASSISDHFAQMLENINLTGEHYNTIMDNLEQEVNSGKIGRYTSILLDKTPFASASNDTDKKTAAKLFYDTMNGLRTAEQGSEDRETYVKLQTSANAAVSKINQSFEDVETSYADMGNSIQFDAAVKGTKSIDNEIDMEQKLLENDERSLQSAIEAKLGRRQINTLQETIKNRKQRIRALRESKGGVRSGYVQASGIGSKLDEYSPTSADSLTDYTMLSKDDRSTHGLIDSIYHLLLDGITVYPQQARSKEAMERYNIRVGASSSIISKAKDEQKSKDLEKYETVSSFMLQHYADEEGNLKIKFFTLNTTNNQMDPLDIKTLAEAQQFEDGTLYVLTSSKNALDNERARATKTLGYRSRQDGSFKGPEILSKIPFFGKLLQNASQNTDSALYKVSSTLSGLLDNTLYGMKDPNASTIRDIVGALPGGDKIVSGASFLTDTAKHAYENKDQIISDVKTGAKSAWDNKGELPGMAKDALGTAATTISGAWENRGELFNTAVTSVKDSGKAFSEKLDSMSDGEFTMLLNSTKDMIASGKGKVDETTLKLINSEAMKRFQDSKVYQAGSTAIGVGKDALGKLGGFLFGKKTDVETGEEATQGVLSKGAEKSQEILSQIGKYIYGDGSVKDIINILTHDVDRQFNATEFREKLRKHSVSVLSNDVLNGAITKLYSDEGTYRNDIAFEILLDEIKTREEDPNLEKETLVDKGKNFFSKLGKKVFGNKRGKVDKDPIPTPTQSPEISDGVSKIQGHVKGSTAEQEANQRQAEIDERDKVKTASLEKMAKGIEDLQDGVKIDRKSINELDEALEDNVPEIVGGEGGEGGGLSGLLSMIPGGNKIAGKTKGVGKALSGVGNLLGKTKVGGALAKAGTLLGGGGAAGGGVLSTIGSVFGGGGAAAGAASAATTAAGAAGAAGSVASAAAGTTKSVGLIKGLLTSVLGKMGLKEGAKKGVIKGITEGITKNIAKLSTRVASLSSSIASVVGIAVPVAIAVGGFAKGMLNVKKDFGLGEGIEPSWGMRLSSGLTASLDGLLLGIPGMIAKAAGYPTLAHWFFELVGSKEDKEAIRRYEQYNKLRSKIFGINDPKLLATWENRTGVGRAISNIGKIFGGKGSDGKEAKMLGFVSVKVFTYWRDNKYQPLSDLRQDVATEMGIDLKAMDKMRPKAQPTTPEDATDEQTEPPGKEEEQIRAMALQQEFRKKYLERARQWVLENKLAWLTNETDEDSFAKYTNPSKMVAVAQTKAGLSPEKAAEEAHAVKVGDTPEGGSGKVGKAEKAAKAIETNFGKTILGNSLYGKITSKIASTAIKNPKVMGAIDTAKTFASIVSLKKMWSKFIKHDKVKNFDMTPTTIAMDSIIAALNKYVQSSTTFSDTLYKKLMPFMNVDKETINDLVSTFIEKMGSLDEVLGIDNETPNLGPEVKVAAGMIGLLESKFPEFNTAVSNIYNKSLKMLIFDIIVKKNRPSAAMSMYEKYRSERAKILGLRIDNMEAYESQYGNAKTFMGGLAGLAKFGAGIKRGSLLGGLKNLFGNTDNVETSLLGFEHVDIFKFWKAKRYNPVIDIERSTASKYGGDYEKIVKKDYIEKDQQNRFIEDFITTAGRFVNSSGISWLTYKTTLKEFNDRKKSGKLVDMSTTYTKTAQANIEAESKKTYSLWDKLTGKQARDEKELSRSFQGSATDIRSNYTVDITKESDAITKELYKRYGYENHPNAMQAMNNATNAIGDVWLKADPNFYGDVTPKVSVARENYTTRMGERVPEGGGSGNRVVMDGERINVKTKTISSRDTTSGSGQATSVAASSVRDETYDMSGQTPKAAVMNSIVSDFAKNFGNELNKRLEILEAIHNEQTRHNSVSETFYTAILTLVSKIASQDGNKQTASAIDMLVRQISQ